MADHLRTDALDWDDLRYFVALVREGSLSATARALKVNHATVARRLAHLENRLSKPLFERRPDGYVLTAEGEALLAPAAAMDEAALAILRRADIGTEFRGLVRITTTPGFADSFLMPQLGRLQKRHAGIDIEVVGESRNLSLARRETDIAIRLGRPKDGESKARRVAIMGFRFYATRNYLKTVVNPADHRFITFDEENATVPQAVALRHVRAGRRVAFQSNSQIAQAIAANQGIGVALLPCYLAAQYSGLGPVDLGEDPLSREIWLLIRRDLARVPRVRAVAEGLIEIFEREKPHLAGAEGHDRTDRP
jgi:DNA-binding transcriptional LysR family regulator